MGKPNQTKYGTKDFFKLVVAKEELTDNGSRLHFESEQLRPYGLKRS